MTMRHTGLPATMTRRAGLRAAAIGLVSPLAVPFAPAAFGQTTPAAGSDNTADREYLVQVLTATAEPVLEALAAEELHKRLPVHAWEQRRAAFTHYEAFARTLAGIAPWLELGPDDTAEGQLRARFIDLSRQALI